MITKNDFLILLYDVANEVGQELDNRKSGEIGIGSVEDLELIFIELTSLASSLIDSSSEPSPDRKHLKSAGIVIMSSSNFVNKSKLLLKRASGYRNELSDEKNIEL